MVLPPDARNQKIYSDVEDLPNDLNKNTVNLSNIFEPAGEVEVFAPASFVEVAPPKHRKTSTQLWTKATIFDKDIPAEPLGNLTDAYQHLLVHSSYEQWRLFVRYNLSPTIVKPLRQSIKT